MSPLHEKYYVQAEERTTENLAGVIQAIPSHIYATMRDRIKLFSKSPIERGMGVVKDMAAYYVFEGTAVFAPHGVAQVGKATTADNRSGFNMIRLFANSAEEMAKLERECGRYESKPLS